ncbi:TolC family protein [bacterium]|nr:TolC family protein [bacterium]
MLEAMRQSGKFIVSLFLFSPAVAAGMTFRDCIQETSANNPQLRAAAATADRARAQESTAAGNFLPSVSLSASRTRDVADVTSNLTGISGKETNWDSSLGVTVKESLFNGLSDLSRLRQAAASRGSASFNQEKTNFEVASAMGTAFIQSVYGNSSIKLQKDLLDRRQSNLRLVQLRFEGGRENKGAMLRSQAAFAQTRYELSQAEGARRVKLLQLAGIMGRRDSAGLEVEGDLPSAGPVTMPDSFDVESHPAVRAAAMQSVAAGHSVEVVRGRFFPEVSASAFFGKSSNNGNSWKSDARVGVSVSMPLDVNASIRDELRAATADKVQAESQLASVVSDIRNQVASARQDVQDASDRIIALTSALAASRVQAEIARSQYSLGLVSFQDWDMVENDLISNEKSMLAGRRDLALAKVALARALGKGLTELEVQIP